MREDEIITLDERIMTPSIRAAAASDIGRRQEQQDAILSFERNNMYIFAVCDGMGGMNSGGVASETAVRVLEKDFQGLAEQESVEDFLISAVTKIDSIVEELKDKNGQSLKCGTTMVTVVVRGQEVSWASVGDSKIFFIRNGKIITLTREHNYRLSLDILKKRGMISQEYYNREVVNGEALISYLGMGKISLIDTSPEKIVLQKDDVLLLCSDGLYKNMEKEEILHTVQQYQNMKEAVDALIKKTISKRRDNQDNITVVLIKYTL